MSHIVKCVQRCVQNNISFDTFCSDIAPEAKGFLCEMGPRRLSKIVNENLANQRNEKTSCRQISVINTSSQEHFQI